MKERRGMEGRNERESQQIARVRVKVLTYILTPPTRKFDARAFVVTQNRYRPGVSPKGKVRLAPLDTRGRSNSKYLRLDSP